MTNTEQNKKEMLGTAPVGKLLLRLALPTVVAQLINMLYNIVDRIYIGHSPEVGDLALTGVGVCMPIIMIVSAFAAFASSGGAPRASIFLGKGEREEAERTLGGCVALQLVISALLTAVLLLFARPVLLAFGASDYTLPYALRYMRIYAVGTLFVQLTLGCNAFLTAQGKTRVAMASVLIGAVCNLVLDPILIYACDMGVAGAAIATVISQGLSCLYALSHLLGRGEGLAIRARYLRLSPSVVLPCLALGSAFFVMQASESVIAVAFNTSLRSFGGDVAVGAMTILTSVMQLALLPVNGVAQGAQPILGYNFGAKNAARVKATFRLLLFVCLGYTMTVFLLVMCFPRLFPAIFTSDPALLDFTAGVIRTYFLGVGIFGIQVACQMTFVSLGQSLSSVTVAVVRKFVLLLPLIYLVPHMVADPLYGVYLAEPIADIVAVTFTAVLFAFRFRRVLKNM